MESCEKKVGFDEAGKRSLRAILVMLLFILLIETARDLPGVHFSRVNCASEPQSEADLQRTGVLPAEDIPLKDIEGTMTKRKIVDKEVRPEGLKESVYRGSKSSTSPVALPAVKNIAGTYVPDISASVDVAAPQIPSGCFEENTSEVPQKPVEEIVIDSGKDSPEVVDSGNTGGTPGGEEAAEPEEEAGPAEEPEPAEQGKPAEEPTAESSGFLVNEEEMIYSYDPEAGMQDEGILELPGEGCAGILAETFTGVGAGIYELHIPANVTYIEAGALKELIDLGDIEVCTDNPSFASSSGILMDRSMTTILMFPPCREGIYRVDSSVTRLAEYSFAGSKLKALDMMGCGIVEIPGNALEGSTLGIYAPREYTEEYRSMFPEGQVAVW